MEQLPTSELEALQLTTSELLDSDIGLTWEQAGRLLSEYGIYEYTPELSAFLRDNMDDGLIAVADLLEWLGY